IIIASGSASANLVRGQTATVNLTINKSGSEVYYEQAIAALQNAKWNEAKDSFVLSLSLNPANNDAHLGFVVTNLALLIDTPVIQDLLKDVWEVYGADLKIDPTDPDDTIPTSKKYLDPSEYSLAPAKFAINYTNNIIKKATKGDIKISRLQNILLNTILPELNKSINSIDTIFYYNPSFQFNITYAMTPDPYDHERDQKSSDAILYQIDKPSLDALKSILYALKGVIYYICSYDWDVSDYSETYFKTIQTKAALISQYPDLGKLKSTNYMVQSRQAFISALESAKTALQVAKQIRDAGLVTSEKLYNYDDFDTKDFNDAVANIDTALYYIRDGNPLRGDDRFDIDLDGNYETVYPVRFFTNPIQDFKVFLPDVLDYDTLSAVSFSKSALDFLFANLTDTAFNKYLNFINIKSCDDQFMIYGTQRYTSDIDNDNIADLTISLEGSYIRISAASGKKVVLLNTLLLSSIDTINVSDGSQQINFNTQYDYYINDFSKANMLLIGFQTSKGLYAVSQLMYIIYQSEYLSGKIFTYINARGENKFWNIQRTSQFAVYGSNADRNYYYDYGLNLIEEGETSPTNVGWQFIGNYTFTADSYEILVLPDTAYKNFLIVASGNNYVFLSPEMLLNQSSGWWLSSGSLLLTGSYKNSGLEIMYSIFDVEYYYRKDNYYGSYYYADPNLFNQNGFFKTYRINSIFAINYQDAMSELMIYLLNRSGSGI
nr:hypothetical protein [bacterium]